VQKAAFLLQMAPPIALYISRMETRPQKDYKPVQKAAFLLQIAFLHLLIVD
jgi:hypothetical protein